MMAAQWVILVGALLMLLNGALWLLSYGPKPHWLLIAATLPFHTLLIFVTLALGDIDWEEAKLHFRINFRYIKDGFNGKH